MSRTNSCFPVRAIYFSLPAVACPRASPLFPIDPRVVPTIPPPPPIVSNGELAPSR